MYLTTKTKRTPTNSINNIKLVSLKEYKTQC